MDLFEYQGRELFEKFGLPVLPGAVISSVDELECLDTKENVEYVVKAQVLTGGRGKAGGVKFARKENLRSVTSKILGMHINGHIVEKVMIVEKVSIDKEYYLSLSLNRSDRNITMLFSTEGGVDIETIAENYPDRIFRAPLFHFKDNERQQVKDILKDIPEGDHIFSCVEKLLRVMKGIDATLVEINPLALSRGELVAIDAKVTLDNNALYRHTEYASTKNLAQSEIEQQASDFGLQYVELNGDIAIIGNGAGLVMATLDVLNHFGGKPANFLDIGGGASVEIMEHALEVVLMKEGVKGILINIFGGITRCDEIATGLVNYVKNVGIHVPIVVRMTGTYDEEGKKILSDGEIPSYDSMDECVHKICKLAESRHD